MISGHMPRVAIPAKVGGARWPPLVHRSRPRDRRRRGAVHIARRAPPTYLPGRRAGCQAAVPVSYAITSGCRPGV